MWHFIWDVVAVIIGAFVTWLASRYYYKKAGDELRAEADGIRKLSNLIGHALEQAGLAEFKRDDKGEMTAIYVDVKATGGAGIPGTGIPGNSGDALLISVWGGILGTPYFLVSGTF